MKWVDKKEIKTNEKIVGKMEKREEMAIKENKTREKIKGTKEVDMEKKMENRKKGERISKQTKEIGEIREANLKAKNMVEKEKLGVKPKDVINNTGKKKEGNRARRRKKIKG